MLQHTLYTGFNFYENLDVLESWKRQTLCYAELTYITCDDLSILITTVASESKFSVM